jgi:hypothetical protein
MPSMEINVAQAQAWFAQQDLSEVVSATLEISAQGVTLTTEDGGGSYTEFHSWAELA